jgi:hypothetical protein
MLKAVSVTCVTSLALALGGAFAQDDSEQYPQKKISLFTAIDIGRVESGRDLRENNFEGANVSAVALNRTYVNVNYTERLDEHYLVSIGVGGIFWRAFAANSGSIDDKVIKFGPGISNAYMQWLPTENVDLTFGFFPYK